MCRDLENMDRWELPDVLITIMSVFEHLRSSLALFTPCQSQAQYVVGSADCSVSCLSSIPAKALGGSRLVPALLHLGRAMAQEHAPPLLKECEGLRDTLLQAVWLSHLSSGLKAHIGPEKNEPQSL